MIPRRHLRVPLAAVCVAALALFVFLPAGEFSFVPVDDEAYVAQNALVRDGLSWRAAARAFTSLGVAANWIPVTWISHMIDVSLFGFAPGPHHLVNVAIHAAAAALLFLVLHGMTGAAGRSALVAALFAVHPLRVESVAWVAERKDVLAAFFWVCALAAWLRYARRPGLARYLLVCGAVALGLMAKPMVVTIPCALLLLDVWPLGRWQPAARNSAAPPGRAALRRLLLEKLPLLVLSAGAAALTLAAQRRSGALHLMDQHHLPLRAANALLSYVRYLGMTFWPAGLSPFYTYGSAQFLSWQVAGAAALLAAVTAVALLRLRRRPWLAFGWCWFLGVLVPTIGMVQVGGQPLADRYTYLPSIGLFVALCWGGWDLLQRRLSPPSRALLSGAISLLLVATLATAARAQLAWWRDGETLLARARQVAPGHFVLTSLDDYNRGVDAAQAGRLEEAKTLFKAALGARLQYADAWNGLGAVLFAEGRAEEAVRCFRRGLLYAPRDAKLHENLGTALESLGSGEEAARSYQEALRLDPDAADAQAALKRLQRKK